MRYFRVEVTREKTACTFFRKQRLKKLKSFAIATAQDFWKLKTGKIILFLFPAILLLGVYLTDSYYWGYLVPLVACVYSYQFIIPQLKKSLRQSLITWILLGLFILGYFLKFFAIRLFPDNSRFWLGYFIGSLPDDPDLMTHAFWVASLGFCGFCFGSLFGLKKTVSEQPMKSPLLSKVGIVRPNLIFFLNFFIVFLAITAWLQFKYDIATLNNKAPLPFRLGGIIHYLRFMVVPYLALICIDLSHQLNMKKLKIFFILLLVLHALSESILMASRGAFLMILFPVFFWMLLTAKLGKIHFRVFILAVLFAAASHSMITHMRGYRFFSNYASKDIYGAFKNSLNNSDGFIGDLKIGLGSIFFRVTGVDGVIAALAAPETRFSVDRTITLLTPGPDSLSKYSTSVLAGYQGDLDNTGISPGLLAAFYVLGGYLGVFCGIFLWVAGWRWLWNKIIFSNFQTSKLMLATLAFLFLFFSMEGTLDLLFLPAIATLFSFFVGEKMFKSLTMKKIL